MPKISVIIPVYNVEKYIEQCLDSVVNQTLKDIEIICINDGSTDSSGQILDKYAQSDNRIKVIHQKNSGLGNARNTGNEYASGDYVFYLDSDDFIELDALEKLYAKSSALDLDICVCGNKTFDAYTKEYNVTDSIYEKYLPPKEVFSSIEVKDSIFHLFVGWVWDKLYKRSLIIDNNLKFPGFKNSEDTSFTYLALILAKRISVIKEPLHVYRCNVTTSVSSTRESEPDAFIKAMELLKNDLKSKGLYETFEMGFINYFISFSEWHLTTISEVQRESLYIKIIDYLKSITCNKENLKFLNPKISKLYRGYTTIDTYKEFEKKVICQQTFLEQIFSIKNYGIYKVCTVLGLKIKIKRKIKNA